MKPSLPLRLRLLCIYQETEQRKAELKSKIEAIKQAETNTAFIQEACQLVRANLKDLTFASKRLALEALNIRVYGQGKHKN